MAQKIHIENLQIRLKNVSPEQAKNIGGNLGNEVLRHLADGKRINGTRRIENLNSGAAIKSELGATDLQSRIARKIAGLIGERND